mmetsp:Transcript_83808/g.184142  ORF Transcript_83808/g.184142 Transcript_83808/m.184142 type:complete len:367 (+) Transcript_83808:845-1945(+)|eukprot:CAMPEP_0206619806 /NCGR_PEP_ID=MMETSP0325_2-20121206/61111_1 /ASSEMBLY_ACC=CAM_ASM_000347 /TAXON_ID=2866 /ORGANISM="Crypthecodinium cohnii, Strain Seligo" /LENGTH=366 /DNA_ID=CAMNT_0054142373 /DNA_START=369 /DNA_END=1469 /DNA_ORIENTATION=-
MAVASLFKKSSFSSVHSSSAAAMPPVISSTLPIAHLKELVNGRSFSFNDFDLKATVGTGTFGRVRVVKIKDDKGGTPLALKIMKKSEVLRLKQVEHIKAETSILSSIEHPFIVNLLANFQDDRRLFLLLEFINGGELFSYLRKEGRLPDAEARFFSGEIVLAFSYLHGKGIIYRDLKPENLLIDCDGHIKITDFGFAKVVEERTWTLCGTPEYLAPEIIQSKGHGRAVDWWALGILCFEMLAGYPPFYDENPFGIYQKVLAGKLDFPKHFDVKVKDLIKRLLTPDRAKRLGCLKNGPEDIMKHKWYKGMDWDALGARLVKPAYVPDVKSPDDTSMFDKYPESTEASAPAIAPKDQELFNGFAVEIK